MLSGSAQAFSGEAPAVGGAAPAVELEELLNVDEIIKRLIPVYDKYYSEEDLREIIQFHKSPAGQKVIETTPLIMKESVGVSIKYFKEKMSP